MNDRRYVASCAIKPRKATTNADRPIVAVMGDAYCDEAGRVGTFDELLAGLRSLPPQIVAYHGESVRLLAKVEARYGNLPYRGKTEYQSLVTPFQRQIFRPKCPERPLFGIHSSVRFFGWSNEKCGRGNTTRHRYHLLIDPVTFCDSGRPERTLAALMAWCQEIRDFCVAQRKNVTPTAGGIGRQFLVDPRFYPNPRRKVPRATNDRARSYLPGNHYQLTVEAGTTEYSGEYLDQTKSHHYHARTARLPDSDTLYGYRSFRSPETATTRYEAPRRAATFLKEFSGLVYGQLRWPLPRRAETSFIPEYLRDFTTRLRTGDPCLRYIWTADLPLLQSLGVEVTKVIAAWGSYDRDTGLAAFAKWATEYSGANPSRLIKAILLTPYGALATTPDKHRVGYHHSKRGRRQVLRSNSGVTLKVSVHETQKESEPGTNNVIHRGLIEASNRAETLMFARHLQGSGVRVLCIYVDGVIVESGNRELLLLDPWRHHRSLTQLKFLGPAQFVSVEESKLPGVARGLPELTREQIALRGYVGRYKTTAEKREHWRPGNRRSATEVRRIAIEEHDKKVLGSL